MGKSIGIIISFFAFYLGQWNLNSEIDYFTLKLISREILSIKICWVRFTLRSRIPTNVTTITMISCESNIKCDKSSKQIWQMKTNQRKTSKKLVKKKWILSFHMTPFTFHLWTLSRAIILNAVLIWLAANFQWTLSRA